MEIQLTMENKNSEFSKSIERSFTTNKKYKGHEADPVNLRWL